LLAWYYIPGGIADIPELNLRIHGYDFFHLPVEIPYGIYRKYKKMLTLAPLTPEWLTSKYGDSFDFSVTYTEITKMPYKTLLTMARKMGVYTGKGNVKHKALAMLIRKSLREQ
jgi:hypothetical protein